MKVRIWTGVITLVLSVVILRYYITGPETARQAMREQQESSSAEKGGETGKDTKKTEALEDKTEEEQAPAAGEKKEPADEDPASETDEEVKIRVLIKTDDFQDIFHSELRIAGTGDFQVQQGDRTVTCQGGDIFDTETFYEEQGFTREEPVRLSSLKPEEKLEVLNLKRNDSPPAYPGTLEIYKDSEGYRLINELALEEYLPSVLSSEMGGGFHGEALKAQAVSARTYALKCVKENGGGCCGADLDDSVSFQVYNNMPADEATSQAVEDTAGLVLETGEGLAEVSYFSTSSGVTSEDCFETEEDFRTFILEGRESDPERGEAWYRWSAVITPEEIRNNLNRMGFEAPETVTGIGVTKRSSNGQARELEILGKHSSLHITGEYQIRQALSPGTAIRLQDGSSCDPMELLPSAWFIIDRSQENREPGEGEAQTDGGGTEDLSWELTGGGFGHGNGMSQNGARIMAEQGKTFREILKFYYPHTQVRRISD